MKPHNSSNRKYALIILLMLGTLLCLSDTLVGPVNMCVSSPVSNRILFRENIVNINYSFRNWNKLMHCNNGNKRNILKVGHWNGGPSHLGRLRRGHEKMESIKELLTLHNLDAMGISEANIEKNTEDSLLQVDGYNMIRSKGDIARLCIYYKKDLKVKLVNYNTNDSSAIWLEIGERKNKWLLCNYYREHSLLGVPGSNTPELQSLRFENFLSDVELVPAYRNLLIICDFNINLLDENNGNSNELKDSILDRFPLLGLTQTVRNSTRHCENSNSSLIDHS